MINLIQSDHRRPYHTTGNYPLIQKTGNDQSSYQHSFFLTVCPAGFFHIDYQSTHHQFQIKKNIIMEKNRPTQEILLLTASSFAHGELCDKDLFEDNSGKRLSPIEKLEEATSHPSYKKLSVALDSNI